MVVFPGGQTVLEVVFLKYFRNLDEPAVCILTLWRICLSASLNSKDVLFCRMLPKVPRNLWSKSPFTGNAPSQKYTAADAVFTNRLCICLRHLHRNIFPPDIYYFYSMQYSLVTKVVHMLKEMIGDIPLLPLPHKCIYSLAAALDPCLFVRCVLSVSFNSEMFGLFYILDVIVS